MKSVTRVSLRAKRLTVHRISQRRYGAHASRKIFRIVPPPPHFGSFVPPFSRYSLGRLFFLPSASAFLFFSFFTIPSRREKKGTAGKKEGKKGKEKEKKSIGRRKLNLARANSPVAVSQLRAAADQWRQGKKKKNGKRARRKWRCRWNATVPPSRFIRFLAHP